jgi:hypothetical protein
MKKLFIVILAGIAMAYFTSCTTETTPVKNVTTEVVIDDKDTSDIDTTKTTASLIVGEWQFVKTLHSNGVATIDGSPYGTYDLSSTNETGTLLIKDDDQYVFNCGFDEARNWNLNGSMMTLENKGMKIDKSGYYIHDEPTKILTLKHGFQSEYFMIKKLTENELIISIPILKTEFDETLGKSIRTEATAVYQFTR